MLTKPAYAVDNVQNLPDLVQDQAALVKQTMDKVGADTKTYLEALCVEIDTELATKEELNAVVTGGIPDGSVTDAKLSNAADQIKDRFTTHSLDNTKHLTISQDRFIFGADSKGTTFQSTGVDSIAKSGFYYVTTDFTNLPVATNCYVIHHQSSSADYALQLAAPVGTSDIYMRRKSGAVWGSWSKQINALDYTRSPGYGITAGSANAYTLTLSPALTLADGVCVAIKIHAANTGASTLNVNGTGAKNLLKADGTAMAAGDLTLNGIYTFRYNGTSFTLQGDGGSSVILAAGDNLLINNSASVTIPTQTTPTYTKAKETRINFKGVVRVKFTGQQSGTPLSGATKGRVYINGVAVGIERDLSNGTNNNPMTYSEDFTVNKNDLIQIYAIPSTTRTATIYDFILSASVNPIGTAIS